MKNTIAVVGASGYIGRHLVAELTAMKEFQVKLLARPKSREMEPVQWPDEVEVIQGDLSDPESLQSLLVPGCTVVNLVYLWKGGEQENLAVIRNLLDACTSAGVKRLIHCSTAAVSGRVADDQIREATECRPITEYGITKLRIEKAIMTAAEGHFEAAILRPTAVFGAEAEPLKKLTADLVHGCRLRNYLKSCLFGRRRMNLVHIGNVVAAILFLIRYSGAIGGEAFIVSDDDSPGNNFLDVERYLMRSLGLPDYALPRLSIPLGVLSLLLKSLGRNNVNPRGNYIQGKLQGLGFESPVAFEEGLADYAEWYRSVYLATHSGLSTS